MASEEKAGAGLARMDAEEFVRRLKERPAGTGYAFLLGAGCSVSSGIPSAGALVKEHWLPRLQRYKMADGDVDAWAVDAIEGYDPGNPARSYGPVMEDVFRSGHEKQKEVERICGGRDPGFGFCVLAKLIEAEGADFNVVLTTNFDDLVADALYLFTRSRPLVISHGALASFMLADPRKPLVAKLHGDYQLQPLNTKAELAKLSDQVNARLQRLLQQRGLIVIGYAGNDDSVMGALRSLPSDALGPGVWWVARQHPNDDVSAWLAERSGCWVEAASFDQLMLLIRDEFDLAHPELSRWEALRNSYIESLDALRSNVHDMPTSDPAAEALKRASSRAIEGITDWWAVELEARQTKTSDPDTAAKVYEQGLLRLPNSAALVHSYANFLTDVRGEHDRAEELYQRALELDPNDADTVTSYACFLTDVRGDLDEARRLHVRALGLDPDDSNLLGNYARTLIWSGDVAQGLELVDAALSSPPLRDSLKLELWFYRFANGSAERRSEALANLKRLTLDGASTPYWDFSGNVTRAVEDGHPDGEWLERLAAVVTGNAKRDLLHGWPSWQGADGVEP